MRELTPIGSFAAEKERQSANTEVWKSVSKDNRDRRGWIKFTSTKRGADSSVAAANDEEIHGCPF
jgi:hypothetical protein